MLKDHNSVTPMRLEPAALQSGVKHSTTEPMCSHCTFHGGGCTRSTRKFTLSSWCLVMVVWLFQVPHNATGLSAVFHCGISRSYSLFLSYSGKLFQGLWLLLFHKLPNCQRVDNAASLWKVIYQGVFNIYILTTNNIFGCVPNGIKYCYLFVCLILYVPSTIFQLNRDGSTSVEPVLS